MRDAGNLEWDGEAGTEQDASEPDAQQDAGAAAPVVMLLTPSPAENPSMDPVLTQSTIDVMCQALPGETGEPINPSSVQVRIYIANELVRTQNTVTAGDDLYTATVALHDLPAGPVTIECTAEDTAASPHRGSKSVDTFLDRGPNILFTTPSDGAAVGATADVPVNFVVSAFKLAENDPDADVDPSSVELRVNGVLVPQQPAASAAPGTYTYTIDFANEDVFPVSGFTSTEIEVRARNLRAPVPAQRTTKVRLVVDGDGPVVNLISPAAGQIVGGEVTVTASMNDSLSGLDASALRLEIPTAGTPDAYHFDLRGTNYVATFQVGKYIGRSQLTLNVIAVDKAGNETRVGRPVELDSVPPWVSLDPPTVREVYANQARNCSVEFDPIGEESVNDLDSIYSADGVSNDRYRILVWERGIANSGDNVTNLSGVKEGSVYLYIQGNPNVPLIVNRDKDPANLCDSVNADPPGDLDPVALNYAPVPPAGNPAKATSVEELAEPYIAQCTAPGNEPCPDNTCRLAANAAPGPALCLGESEMRKVIRHNQVNTNTPVVYALTPANGTNNLNCTGVKWESTVAGGWTCAVAVAQDNVGNLGISAPLRVCYALNGAAGCDGPPPSCTDGCVMPGKFVDQGMPRVLVR